MVTYDTFPNLHRLFALGSRSILLSLEMITCSILKNISLIATSFIQSHRPVLLSPRSFWQGYSNICNLNNEARSSSHHSKDPRRSEGHRGNVSFMRRRSDVTIERITSGSSICYAPDSPAYAISIATNTKTRVHQSIARPGVAKKIRKYNNRPL